MTQQPLDVNPHAQHLCYCSAKKNDASCRNTHVDTIWIHKKPWLPDIAYFADAQ